MAAKVLGVRTDVAKPADVEALAAAAVERFGGVHVLCNNAGVSVGGPMWEHTLDDWQWVLGVNLWGVDPRHPHLRAHHDAAAGSRRTSSTRRRSRA